VIPVRLDGSKAPAAKSWTEYQERIATPEEIESWFERPFGIGIVAGFVSGGLEILDFDLGELFWPWFDLVPGVAGKLPVVETPSDGYHVFYRCEKVGGNCKIATDAKAANDKQKKTLIETRGQGGYVVGAGSPLGVHSIKNRTYIQTLGPELPEIPTISAEERLELWKAARSFTKDALPKVVKQEPKPALLLAAGPCDEVIGRFNQYPDWHSLLPGWSTYDGIHWTRPDKAHGVSAKVVSSRDGVPVLTVFSSSAGVLAPSSGKTGQSYSAFELLVRLHFKGDRKAAFKHIKRGQQ
jgi:putative DNA primase/helicase